MSVFPTQRPDLRCRNEPLDSVFTEPDRAGEDEPTAPVGRSYNSATRTRRPTKHRHRSDVIPRLGLRTDFRR